MGWECFCVVGFDLGPLLQGGTRILHLQYFFKYVLTYFLHLNSYLVTFLHNTICRAQLFCPFLLSASEFLLNMLFNYHLLYFCTALSLIILLSLSPSQIKNTQSADTVPVHGHAPLVLWVLGPCYRNKWLHFGKDLNFFKYTLVEVYTLQVLFSFYCISFMHYHPIHLLSLISNDLEVSHKGWVYTAENSHGWGKTTACAILFKFGACIQ